MGKIRTRNQYQAEFVKCIQKFGGKYQTWEIFADFISMFACAISNGIDRVHFKPREEMYMQIIRKYTNEEQAIFPEMMGCIWLWTWEAIGKDSFLHRIVCVK